MFNRLNKKGENMENKLKEMRESKDLSQEELAEKSGVSRTTISNIENGKQVILKTKTLIDLADALGTKVSKIFCL